MTPDLIIFDCDGVLVDSEVIAGPVFAECVRELGMVLSAEDERRRFRGLSMASSIPMIEAEISRAVPADWPATVWRRIGEAMEAALEPIPNVDILVGSVAEAGLPRCVASSSTPAHIARALELTGLIGHFNPAHLFSAEMVARGKPAPDLFLHAAGAFATPPEGAVVIEDSLPGVRAGVAAGMRVIGYAGAEDADPAALEAAGAEVVTAMADVPRLIGL